MPPRPLDVLSSLARRYPRIWREVDSMRDGRGKDLPEWPAWCHLPLAGGLAIASRGVLDPSRIDLVHTLDAAIIAALAAWRVTKGIYRFDPDVYRALVETTISGPLPVDLLYRLPEWCVYLETPGLAVTAMPVEGVFVHLEWDAATGREELRLLLAVAGAEDLVPVALYLIPGSTLEASLVAMTAEAQRHHGLPAQGVMDLSALAQELSPILSLALYLCSEEPDLVDEAGRQARPERPAPKKIKGGERHFEAIRTTVWRAGGRLGAGLRQAAAHGGEAGVSPSPHVRRAHWHTYVTGEGARRDPSRAVRVLRWIHPVLVGAQGEEPMVTIRRVKRTPWPPPPRAGV